jgi:hypothetical protein
MTCRHKWRYWVEMLGFDIVVYRQCLKCECTEWEGFDFCAFEPYEPYKKELRAIFTKLQKGRR